MGYIFMNIARYKAVYTLAHTWVKLYLLGVSDTAVRSTLYVGREKLRANKDSLHASWKEWYEFSILVACNEWRITYAEAEEDKKELYSKLLGLINDTNLRIKELMELVRPSEA